MKIFLISVAVLILAAFCWHLYNTVYMDVHYRLTVTLVTPEGEVSGSAVRAVSNSAKKYELIDWPESGNPADERGEAVVVDMVEKGVLFALIDWDSDRELYYGFDYDSGGSTYEGLQYFNSLYVGDKRELPNQYWPTFVTFTDINDPKTVKRVPSDTIHEYFGEGVSIKSVTVEITDEPVTQGVVDQYLPEGFWYRFDEWWKTVDIRDKSHKASLFSFRKGIKK